jgi:hypothetical protein
VVPEKDVRSMDPNEIEDMAGGIQVNDATIEGAAATAPHQTGAGRSSRRSGNRAAKEAQVLALAEFLDKIFPLYMRRV